MIEAVVRLGATIAIPILNGYIRQNREQEIKK